MIPCRRLAGAAGRDHCLSPPAASAGVLRGNYIGRLQKPIPERSRGMSVRRVVVASMVLAMMLNTMGIGWANCGCDKGSIRGTWGFPAAGRKVVQQVIVVGMA